VTEHIEGKQIDLPRGRHVFVAERPGFYLIEFRSTEGSITRLKLSNDAMSALTTIANAKQSDGEVRGVCKPSSRKARWQVVPEIEA
jgi:hypothetical protein